MNILKTNSRQCLDIKSTVIQLIKLFFFLKCITITKSILHKFEFFRVFFVLLKHRTRHGAFIKVNDERLKKTRGHYCMCLLSK